MNEKRTVALYTWWKAGDRSFCVVGKVGKDAGQGYRTTAITMLEHLNPKPIERAIEEFWQLVDAGKLTEVIPS